MRALARRTGGISRWQGEGVVEQEWSLPEQVFRDGTPGIHKGLFDCRTGAFYSSR
jgi:hypothetical protein